MKESEEIDYDNVDLVYIRECFIAAGVFDDPISSGTRNLTGPYIDDKYPNFSLVEFYYHIGLLDTLEEYGGYSFNEYVLFNGDGDLVKQNYRKIIEYIDNLIVERYEYWN